MRNKTIISVEDFIFCTDYNRNTVYHPHKVTDEDKKRYAILKEKYENCDKSKMMKLAYK